MAKDNILIDYDDNDDNDDNDKTRIIFSPIYIIKLQPDNNYILKCLVIFFFWKLDNYCIFI